MVGCGVLVLIVGGFLMCCNGNFGYEVCGGGLWVGFEVGDDVRGGGG